MTRIAVIYIVDITALLRTSADDIEYPEFLNLVHPLYTILDSEVVGLVPLVPFLCLTCTRSEARRVPGTQF